VTCEVETTRPPPRRGVAVGMGPDRHAAGRRNSTSSPRRAGSNVSRLLDVWAGLRRLAHRSPSWSCTSTRAKIARRPLRSAVVIQRLSRQISIASSQVRAVEVVLEKPGWYPRAPSPGGTARITSTPRFCFYPLRYSSGNFHGPRYSGFARRAASSSPVIFSVAGSKWIVRPSLSDRLASTRGTSTRT